MPVTHVNIVWPDSKEDKVYSPSSVIKEHFKPGEVLTVEEFLAKAETSLFEASERVRLKFGYGCTSAQAELSRIQQKCTSFNAQNNIKITSIN